MSCHRAGRPRSCDTRGCAQRQRNGHDGRKWPARQTAAAAADKCVFGRGDLSHSLALDSSLCETALNGMWRLTRNPPWIWR